MNTYSILFSSRILARTKIQKFTLMLYPVTTTLFSSGHYFPSAAPAGPEVLVMLGLVNTI